MVKDEISNMVHLMDYFCLYARGGQVDHGGCLGEPDRGM
jgi:hypothetical protein